MFSAGALIIRIGFWGLLYYDCSHKEPPKSYGIDNY